METKQKQVAVALGMVRFTNESTINAKPMTEKQERIYAIGLEAGALAGEQALDMASIIVPGLKLAKSAPDRKLLLAAFCTGREPEIADRLQRALDAGDADQAKLIRADKAWKSANNAFEYLAKIHGHASASRKAESNEEKKKSKAGRKEKIEATIKKMKPEQVAACNMHAMVTLAGYQENVAKLKKPIPTTKVLAMLATVAAYLNGTRKS